MKLVVIARLSLCVLPLLCPSGCRAPKDWGEPEREPESGDIEIWPQTDPNDARESYWEIQIWP